MPLPPPTRLQRWLKRYGPAELTGIASALLGSYLVQRLTGNAIAAAYGGAIGENLGFYGVIVSRELHADAALARAAGIPFGPRAWLKTAANLMIEFGAAEILDSAVLRPLAMGLGTHYLGRALGVPLGKLAADITFYVPVILMYEWRRRLQPAPPVPPIPQAPQ